ncbi:MAG: aspartate/glutamate racemase family protein [Halofilum sp. (in: g-proteobacteria)]|nr:aspartate/glutamate racemase family protein [Halofilum sp. (in: g-proteobacteria)]
MKTIGILGGMSWESTALYYRRINEGVRARLGGLHSARIALVSVDFATIEPLQAGGDWTLAGERLAVEARRVEAAGAEMLLLATNTMHRCADAISAAVGIPLLHLADATADAIRAAGVTRVGLLGTRYTMEQPFYRERLEAAGITVDVPGADDRAELDRIIFEELCRGTVHAQSRRRVLRMIDALCTAGSAGIVAGCTEITLLVDAADVPVALFDTTAIHCDAAVAAALTGATT